MSILSPDRQTRRADVIHSYVDDRLASCRFPTHLSTCYQTVSAFDQTVFVWSKCSSLDNYQLGVSRRG